MELGGSFLIAISMYSNIPVPQVKWTKERMKYALCFFPVVGIIVGSVLCLFAKAAQVLLLPPVCYAGLGTVIPLLLTGGIHFDGFLDTVDARSSYQEQSRKLEILKDPHVGAFAVLGAGLYLLLYMSFFSLLPVSAMPIFALTFVVTRALSSLAVVHVKKAKSDGLATAFANDSERRAVTLVMGVLLMSVFLLLIQMAGIKVAVLLTIVVSIVFGWYIRMAKREFGGVTGDLAGYFLQVCELVSLFFVAIAVR